MQVIKKPIAEIKPYWRNPRNTDLAVGPVIESIKQYGYINPIVIDKESVIIAGHTRYKALAQLGYTEVDCIVADHLTPNQAHAFRIIDNKTAEKATWNLDDLMSELRIVQDIAPFYTHFPELKLPDFTDIPQSQVMSPVTAEDIAKTEAQNAVTFENSIRERESKIQTYKCPHCGGSFDVPN